MFLCTLVHKRAHCTATCNIRCFLSFLSTMWVSFHHRLYKAVSALPSLSFFAFSSSHRCWWEGNKKAYSLWGGIYVLHRFPFCPRAGEAGSVLVAEQHVGYETAWKCTFFPWEGESISLKSLCGRLIVMAGGSSLDCSRGRGRVSVLPRRWSRWPHAEGLAAAWSVGLQLRPCVNAVISCALRGANPWRY